MGNDFGNGGSGDPDRSGARKGKPIRGSFLPIALDPEATDRRKCMGVSDESAAADGAALPASRLCTQME